MTNYKKMSFVYLMDECVERNLPVGRDETEESLRAKLKDADETPPEAPE